MSGVIFMLGRGQLAIKGRRAMLFSEREGGVPVYHLGPVYFVWRRYWPRQFGNIRWRFGFSVGQYWLWWEPKHWCRISWHGMSA